MESPNVIRRADSPVVGGSISDQLRGLAFAAARAAQRTDWNGGDRELEVRRLVRTVCEVARAGGAQIEELLIVLKESWRQLPDNRRRTDPEIQATLARIVTITIHEYYRPREHS